MGLLPARSHGFVSYLVTSSSATEALDSPSVSRVPMGGGHAFRIPKTSVCWWQVQRKYTIVRIPEIHFIASGFFLKFFDRLCVFVFVTFWSFFFFFFFFFLLLFMCEFTHYEKHLQTGRINALLCLSFFFRLSHKNSVKSMCYLKIYIKVYLMHKANHA